MGFISFELLFIASQDGLKNTVETGEGKYGSLGK